MNAIKFVLLRSVLSLIFLSGLVYTHAQTNDSCTRGTIVTICEGALADPNQPCSTGGLRAIINEACDDAYVPLRIFCANIPGEPDPNENYQWPDSMPSLHILYTFDGEISKLSPEVIHWQYLYHNSDGFPLYSATINLNSPILSGDICTELERYLFVDISLVTIIDGNLDYYPIQDYNGTWEIFSADVFDDEPEVPFYENNSICLDCSDCLEPDPDPDPDPQPQPNPDNHSQRRQTLSGDLKNSVSIYPNPFSNILTYTYYSTTNSEKAITNIYNANGQLLESKPMKVKMGNNKYNFEVEHLPAGVYFIEIKTATFNKFTQVVKLD